MCEEKCRGQWRTRTRDGGVEVEVEVDVTAVKRGQWRKKKQKSNRGPVSAPASPRTPGTKRRATTTTVPGLLSTPSADDVLPRPAGLVDAAGGGNVPHCVHPVHKVVAVKTVVIYNLYLEADGALLKAYRLVNGNAAEIVMLLLQLGG